MINKKKINFTNNTPALNSLSNNTAPTFQVRPKHTLIPTILAGLIGLTLISPIVSKAEPPEHTNEQVHAHLANAIPPEQAYSRRDSEDWVRGRILIMPRAGLPAKALANILKEHDGKPRKIGQSDLHIVDLPEYTEEGVAALLTHHPHIKFAELDHYVSSALIPNDPYYPNGWHLPKINTPQAWGDSQGAGITIAILDSGVDSNHPDLAAKMVPGWNFYDNNSNTADVRGHGTKVAGAAAAITDNNTGVAGVAGQSRIMPIRVSNSNGRGSWSAISQGLTWAADNGARVANLSFLGVTSSSSTRSAAQYMKNKGGLVAVSGGNTGTLENYTVTTSMIPVSATDTNDNRTSWSSYGDYVMLTAPGAGIWTSTIGGGYGAVSGTSFSSPITAGVIALMMAANPKMRNTDIENALFNTAVDLGAVGRDPYYGYGRVDAAAAVLAVITGNTPTDTDTEAPTVSIVEPTGGEKVSGLVPVDVDVFDNIGVTETELWVGNTRVAIDTTEPFAFTWDSNGVENGQANLIVRAYDVAGNVGISDTVTVNVDNVEEPAPNPDDTEPPTGTQDDEPPTVQLINPVAGNVSGRVTITVNASDNFGSSGITLFIYVDNELISNGTGSTLSTSWNSRPKRIKKGLHVIKAVASDAAGNSSTASVTVNVVD